MFVGDFRQLPSVEPRRACHSQYWRSPLLLKRELVHHEAMQVRAARAQAGDPSHSQAIGEAAAVHQERPQSTEPAAQAQPPYVRTHGAFALWKPEQETLELMMPYDLIVVEELGQLSESIFERLIRLWQAAEAIPALVVCWRFLAAAIN